MIERRIERILDRNGFEYCEFSGCFDIAARKTSLMLLKVLGNIDSFQEEQARNLRIISREMDASAMIVGSTTRREVLHDSIIYQRFDVPAMNANTFESVIENDMPVVYRNRGGLFVDINPDALRSKRLKSCMTQEELASEVGITKKNVYEHEKSRIRMSYEAALKIEKTIGKGIIERASIDSTETAEKNRPAGVFEASVSRNLKRIGFSTEIIRQSPVNIIAEDSGFSVISEADELASRIEKNAPSMKKFSDISRMPAIAISKSEVDVEIPPIDEKSLRNMQAGDIKKFVKKW